MADYTQCDKPTLVFATNNRHKLHEVRHIVGDSWRIMSLDEAGIHDDIPETGTTLEENAILKARYVKEHYGYDCFADDTGLIVDALNGAPGVYSARYAGEAHNDKANMSLLLQNMQGVTDRTARFTTVIALIEGDELHTFEGSVEGEITLTAAGNGGFGYDPVFRPEGYDVTFAEMGSDAKNTISHRARATERLSQYLQDRSARQ